MMLRIKIVELIKIKVHYKYEVVPHYYSVKAKFENVYRFWSFFSTIILSMVFVYY